jgi:protein required for attachment to host cells
MQISDHYLPYTKKTLIVVANSEIARLLIAQGRELDELEVFGVSTDLPETRTAASAPIDVDEMKRHSRLELYKEISDRMQELLKEEIEEIILCAPEVHKNELSAAMHTDVTAHVKEIVPKNLASLALDQIIRILQENRTA